MRIKNWDYRELSERIGAAVLANNLMNIAQLLTKKETKKKKTTPRARAA